MNLARKRRENGGHNERKKLSLPKPTRRLQGRDGIRKESAMELKVLCNCGQKFKFDVEPANGRMPFAVACPACNEDATAKADSMIAENLAASPAPAVIAPPPLAPAPGGLRINRTE